MSTLIRILILAILIATPFLGGGRDQFAQELWVLAIGFVALGAGALLCARRSETDGPQRNLLVSPALGAFFVVLGAGIAAFFSPAPHLARMPLLTVASGAMLFFLAARYLAGREHVLAWSLTGTTALLALFGLWFWSEGTTSFLTSFFYFPGAFAAWLLLVIPLAVGLFVQEPQHLRKILIACILALFIIAFLLTGVRGGYLVALAVLPLLVIWIASTSRPRQTLFHLLLIVSVSLAFGFGLLWTKNRNAPPAASTLGAPASTAIQLVDSSTAHRLVFWKGAVKMFVARPATGFGLGTFGSVWPQHQPDPLTFTKWPHSTLFELLAETGLSGTLPFLAFLFTLFFPWGTELLGLRRSSRIEHLKVPAKIVGTTNSNRGSLAVREAIASPQTALAIGLFALTIHSFLDVDFHYPALWGAFWITAGLVAGSLQPSSLHYWYRIPIVPIVGGILLVIAVLPHLKADILRSYAQDFAARKQYVAAAILAERAGGLGSSPSDFLQAAEWFLRQNSFGEARAKLLERADNARVRAWELDPFDADSFAFAAAIAIARNQYDDAVVYAQDALAKDPYNHPEYALLLSDAFIAQSNMPDAEQAIDAMLAKYDDTITASLLEQAKDYYARGEAIIGPAERLHTVIVLLERKAVLREQAGDQSGTQAAQRRAEELKEFLGLLTGLTP